MCLSEAPRTKWHAPRCRQEFGCISQHAIIDNIAWTAPPPTTFVTLPLARPMHHYSLCTSSLSHSPIVINHVSAHHVTFHSIRSITYNNLQGVCVEPGYASEITKSVSIQYVPYVSTGVRFESTLEAVHIEDFGIHGAQLLGNSGNHVSSGRVDLFVNLAPSGFVPRFAYSDATSVGHQERPCHEMICSTKKTKRKQIFRPHPSLLWITKRFSSMVQRCIRLRDSIKFSLYWIVLVASSLIVFMGAASHMQVKPLQFQAPTGSLDDVFVPDVVCSDFLMALLLTRITW